MAKHTVIKLGNNQVLDLLSGESKVVRLPAGSSIEILDVDTGRAPPKVQIKRVGKDLLLELPEENGVQTKLVMEDFYAGEGSHLTGLNEAGAFQEYLPEIAEQGLALANVQEGVAGWLTLQGAVVAGTAGAALTPLGMLAAGSAGVAVVALGGNHASSGSLPPTLPQAPSVALASDSGSSATDKITKTSILNVTGLAAGATWEYSLDGNTWKAGTGTTITDITGDGAKSVQVRQTDAAGHLSAASTAYTFTLDTAVSAPSVALAKDTGSSATDKITNNSTLNVIGLETGSTWEYTVDGTHWLAGSGTTISGITGDGVKNVKVRQTDVAGNTSAESGLFSFTLDTAGPAAPAVALASDTGSSETDKITKTSTLNVTGLEENSKWEYSLDGITWIAGSGTTISGISGDGEKSVQVRQTDLAGNTGVASTAYTFTLDTSVLSPTLALATDSGSSATDKITKDGTLKVTGLESGATWEYSLDGISWTTGIGNSITGITGDGQKSVQVRQTDAAATPARPAPLLLSSWTPLPQQRPVFRSPQTMPRYLSTRLPITAPCT